MLLNGERVSVLKNKNHHRPPIWVRVLKKEFGPERLGLITGTIKSVLNRIVTPKKKWKKFAIGSCGARRIRKSIYDHRIIIRYRQVEITRLEKLAVQDKEALERRANIIKEHREGGSTAARTSVGSRGENFRGAEGSASIRRDSEVALSPADLPKEGDIGDDTVGVGDLDDEELFKEAEEQVRTHSKRISI